MSRQGSRALLEQDPGMRLVADCADGTHAVELCHRLTPDVVVIDADISAPSLVETVRRLRCLPSPPSVVVVATSGSDDLIRDAFESGASGFVVRDAGYRRLQEAIHSSASGEVLIDAFQLNVAASHSRPKPRDPSVLSAREGQILRLIASGLSTKQIATMLHLSPKTVESHRSNIYAKLDVSTLADLIKYAMAHGLADPVAPIPQTERR